MEGGRTEPLELDNPSTRVALEDVALRSEYDGQHQGRALAGDLPSDVSVILRDAQSDPGGRFALRPVVETAAVAAVGHGHGVLARHAAPAGLGLSSSSLPQPTTATDNTQQNASPNPARTTLDIAQHDTKRGARRLPPFRRSS